MQGISPIVGWVLVGLALLVSFGIDFNNMAQGGAIDLRNRITGVRLMERGMDAYHYKWGKGDPEEFCDVYNNPKQTVSKTTVTPTLLILHAPLAILPYRLGQLSWLLLQWVFLLGTGWLWIKASKTTRQRMLIAAFVTGFTYTASWRLHAERGQAYIFLVFVFAGWLTATLNRKWGNAFLTGSLAGFLIALRPPFLLLVPFLALHRRGQLIGAAVGLALSLAAPILIHPACWSEYFSAMQVHSDSYRNNFDPRPGPQSYPAKIEGVPTRTMGNFVAVPYGDYSVHTLLQLGDLEPFPAWPPVLGVTVMFLFWLGFSKEQGVPGLLPGLAAWFFLVDLFLPVYRDSYNDVFILNAVLAGLSLAVRMPWAVWPCVAALPAGLYVYAMTEDRPWLINLPPMLFTMGAVLLVFLPGGRKRDET